MIPLNDEVFYEQVADTLEPKQIRTKLDAIHATEQSHFDNCIDGGFYNAQDLDELAIEEIEGSTMPFLAFARDTLKPLYDGMTKRDNDRDEEDKIFDIAAVTNVIHQYIGERLTSEKPRPVDDIKGFVSTLLESEIYDADHTPLGDAFDLSKKEILTKAFHQNYKVDQAANDIIAGAKNTTPANFYKMVEAYDNMRAAQEVLAEQGVTMNIHGDIKHMILDAARELYGGMTKVNDTIALKAGFIPEQFNVLMTGTLGDIVTTHGASNEFDRFQARNDQYAAFVQANVYDVQDQLSDAVYAAADDYRAAAATLQPEAIENAKAALEQTARDYLAFTKQHATVLEEDEASHRAFIDGVNTYVMREDAGDDAGDYRAAAATDIPEYVETAKAAFKQTKRDYRAFTHKNAIFPKEDEASQRDIRDMVNEYGMREDAGDESRE